MMIFELESL